MTTDHVSKLNLKDFAAWANNLPNDWSMTNRCFISATCPLARFIEGTIAAYSVNCRNSAMPEWMIVFMKKFDLKFHVNDYTKQDILAVLNDMPEA